MQFKRLISTIAAFAISATAFAGFGISAAAYELIDSNSNNQRTVNVTESDFSYTDSEGPSKLITATVDFPDGVGIDSRNLVWVVTRTEEVNTDGLDIYDAPAEYDGTEDQNDVIGDEVNDFAESEAVKDGIDFSDEDWDNSFDTEFAPIEYYDALAELEDASSKRRVFHVEESNTPVITGIKVV